MPCISAAGPATRSATAAFAAAVAAAASVTAVDNDIKHLKILAQRASKELTKEAPWTNWTVIVLSVVLVIDQD